jgi:hypothetical protein
MRSASGENKKRARFILALAGTPHRS